MTYIVLSQLRDPLAPYFLLCLVYNTLTAANCVPILNSFLYTKPFQILKSNSEPQVNQYPYFLHPPNPLVFYLTHWLILFYLQFISENIINSNPKLICILLQKGYLFLPGTFPILHLETGKETMLSLRPFIQASQQDRYYHYSTRQALLFSFSRMRKLKL